MRRALAVLLLAFPGSVGAEPYDSGRAGPSAVLRQALGDEMQRTLERLRLEGLSAPYFLAYTVLESRTVEIEGEFGAIEEPREIATRRLQVEVRTGSREFDDAHFADRSGRAFRPANALIPVEDDYDALRTEIWALTDAAYKVSVEALAQKTVYRERNNVRDLLPGRSEDPPETHLETLDPPPFDRAAWEGHVRAISGAFRRWPAIQSSSVEIAWREQHLYFLDSEGRSFVRPAHGLDLTLQATAQAADGMEQSDERALVWRALEDVPPVEQLVAEAERLAADVTALAAAPKAEAYLGPLLIEGQAAGEFFSQLLAGGLVNPREIWVEQEASKRFYATGALTGRLGQRVIAPLLDVVDDPTLDRFDGQPLSGHYRVDDQGIPARRVQLVEHGILVDLLMSRSPTKERQRSNGHGRGAFSSPAAAMVGNLFVTPSTTTSLPELKSRLREDAAAFGLDHGIVVRRIARERKRAEGDLLSAPVMAYAVDVATGEEHLIRDVRFSGVTLRALRDVVAASDTLHVYNLAKQGPFRSSPALGVGIVHPSVLLSEMELAPTEAKPSKPPYLPHPAFAEPGPDGD